jgi:hypothetical protein
VTKLHPGQWIHRDCRQWSLARKSGLRAVSSSRASTERYRGRKAVQHRRWAGSRIWARFVVGDRKIGPAKCLVRMKCLYHRIGGNNLIHSYTANLPRRDLVLLHNGEQDEPLTPDPLISRPLNPVNLRHITPNPRPRSKGPRALRLTGINQPRRRNDFAFVLRTPPGGDMSSRTDKGNVF